MTIENLRENLRVEIQHRGYGITTTEFRCLSDEEREAVIGGDEDEGGWVDTEEYRIRFKPIPA